MILEMGFEPEAVRAALVASGRNQMEAIRILLEG